MLTFQPLTGDNVEAAAKVYVDCFNAPPWEDDWSLADAVKRLQTLLQFPGSASLVAKRDSKIVGLVIGHCEPWSDGLHLYLNEMCVDPQEQCTGIGQTLLDEFFRQLRAQDIVSVYLLTDKDSGAESFFRKNGFEDDSSSIKLWREI